jgi:hypothetical protein
MRDRRSTARAFIGGASWVFFAGAMGCGSRSALDSAFGEAPASTGAPAAFTPDAASVGRIGDAGGVSQEPPPTRVVLFGGFDSPDNLFLDDTWEWDESAWIQKGAPGPSARAGHAMAALHGKVVLFGGGMISALATGDMLEGGALDDTWEWDGSTWTQRNPTVVPGPRVGHAMATLQGKVILFGGAIAGSGSGGPETWAWDGDTWTLVATTGPAERSGHTMTTVGDRIVLFGGSSERGPLGDTWAWDGSAWTLLSTYGSSGFGPGDRFRMSSAALDGKLWVFGGLTQPGQDSDELWSLDGALWTRLMTGNATPAARYAATMATLGGNVFVFGGDEILTPADGVTYAWNGAAWYVSGKGPSPRSQSAMAAR